MAVMPEASSALFMSQFSDEVVRDAIARVSLLFLPFLPRCTASMDVLFGEGRVIFAES